MQLVLDTKRSAKKSKNPLQKRFDKLRSALDRERRLSERFRQDLDGLVDIYQSRSRENDRRVFDDLVALSERLIVFASRKTLSSWHRGELLTWIRDLSERRIAPIDRKMAERLQREYNEAVARALGMSVEEMLADDEAAESAGDFGEHSDAEFDGGSDDCFDGRSNGDDAEQGRAETPGGGGESGACEEDPRQADMFGFDDIGAESAEAEQAHWSAGEGQDEYDDEDQDEDDEEDENELSRKVMDGSWMKKLFRRAAQMLHPDREPDPRRRESKQARLRELLAARKQGDIMAVLSIYSETVSDADIALAKQEMTQVCDALQSQLNILRMDREEYLYSHPLRHLAFTLFYDNTRKGRERKIRQWERELREEADELRRLVPTLRNLDALKGVLRQRHDERHKSLLVSMLDSALFG